MAASLIIISWVKKLSFASWMQLPGLEVVSMSPFLDPELTVVYLQHGRSDALDFQGHTVEIISICFLLFGARNPVIRL